MIGSKRVRSVRNGRSTVAHLLIRCPICPCGLEKNNDIPKMGAMDRDPSPNYASSQWTWCRTISWKCRIMVVIYYLQWIGTALCLQMQRVYHHAWYSHPKFLVANRLIRSWFWVFALFISPIIGSLEASASKLHLDLQSHRLSDWGVCLRDFIPPALFLNGREYVLRCIPTSS